MKNNDIVPGFDDEKRVRMDAAEMSTRSVVVRNVPEDVHKAFQQYCVDIGLNMNQALIRLMRIVSERHRLLQLKKKLTHPADQQLLDLLIARQDLAAKLADGYLSPSKKHSKPS